MTNDSVEFQTILDDCLRDVLRGTRTIEQCLELYPDHAADLKPALQIGLLTSRLKSPEMPARSVDRLENRLREQMATKTRPKVIRGRFAPFGKLAAMIAIIFLVGLGSVTASANAMPGDWLYGLKRLWEAIVLALTPLTGQVDDLWLQIADRRLDEVEELAQRGQLSDSALYDLYLAMAEAIRLADAETTPNLIAYLTEAQVALIAIQPTPQDEALYADLMLLTAPTLREDGSLEPPPVLPPSRSITPTATSAPTLTPTMTITPIENREVLPTLTATSTETMTATNTLTPRVPATATRTSTPTNTPALPTATNTPLPTPTATWTPLPLPTLPGSTPIIQPTAPPPHDGGIRPTNTPDAEATVRVRETEMSVYLTQTAGPAPTEASPP